MRQEQVYDQSSNITPMVFTETLRGDWEEIFELHSKAINKEKVGKGKLAAYNQRIAGVILEQLGFARPEEQDIEDFAERSVTREWIPAKEGEISFYFTYETGDNESTKLKEDWINDRLFQNLEVAKADRVYKVENVI